MNDELREAYDLARQRLFHSKSHLRYGLRKCGPRCLGCSHLKAAMLAAVDATEGNRATPLIRRDIENFPQERS
jgi:hypothetical protein